MSWYAVDALSDAFDATKELLTPVDARQWLRFALVVFFVGAVGPGRGPPTGESADAPAGAPPELVVEDVPIPTGGVLPASEAVPVLLTVVAVALVVGLLYALVGSVMEFVLVESLRSQYPRIRRYADQHLGQALGLFAFRVALGLVVFLPVAGIALAVVSGAGGQPQVSLGLLALAIPLFFLFALLVGVVNAFTTNFVVPVMIAESVGVLAGWRRFWPTLTREWKQYGVYLLVWVVLGFAVGLLGSVVAGVAGTILIGPVAVLGVLALSGVGTPAAILSSPLGVALAAVAVLAYLAVLLAVVAIVFVPVTAYLRYHALLVLGDANAEFDLIPDLRAEIRGREPSE